MWQINATPQLTLNYEQSSHAAGELISLCGVSLTI